MLRNIAILLIFLISCHSIQAQKKAILAYYAGPIELLDSFNTKQFTHVIYCFGHLQDNRLHLGKARDTAMVQKMVALKKRNPQLKVLLSLGGWGGCKTCSDVFNTDKGRKEFAKSVKDYLKFFGADGIDLDWEYPAIKGFPDHPYRPEDKDNFTMLVQELRKALGKKGVISFAAGGFQRFLEESVDWKKVMPMVDYVNLMTYDLVSGFATTTGHHTGLYSTPQQKESTDNCVSWLINNGVDPGKLIVGAAFYARSWENVEPANNGLYQTGKFKSFIPYKTFPQQLQGYTMYWDDVAKAPYAYHPGQKIYATFDDKRSIEAKAKYVLEKKLGGMMFWELSHDTVQDGLLQVINNVFKP